uniref:GTPase IMAP family member 4-like n=1 Tax=Centroberyx gerrardi TaxID=166262 RepID=UPI003AB01D5F
MECNCKPERDCGASMDDAVTDLWLNSSSVQMGAFTVAGYLLYRFSQTLPALIRWPIRLFCSLTGLSALWSWVSRLVGTLRGIQSLFKWLSRVWRFIVALFSKFSWLLVVIKNIVGFPSRAKRRLESVFTHGRRPSGDRQLETETDRTSSSTLTPTPDLSGLSGLREPDLRLILLGPAGGGRTSLADTLTGAPTGPLMERSRRRTAAVDGREVTVVDTPDLLGSSLGDSQRAREALRSLQLASPGPHAFLLVLRAPGSGTGMDQDVAQAMRTAVELFGGEVTGHVIPVLTHADRLGPRRTLEQLLDADAGGLRAALSLCGQRAELVDTGPRCPPEARRATRRRLVGRVAELRALRGQFVHELQRREEELLDNMASALARKLGHM